MRANGDGVGLFRHNDLKVIPTGEMPKAIDRMLDYRPAIKRRMANVRQAVNRDALFAGALVLVLLALAVGGVLFGR